VVEAGVDISAATLFTEFGHPGRRLWQRFGRCNRYAEYEEARIFWIDLVTGGRKSWAPPYADQALEAARAALSGLEDASPSSLEASHIRPGSRWERLFASMRPSIFCAGETLLSSRYAPRILAGTTWTSLGSSATARGAMSRYSGVNCPRDRCLILEVKMERHPRARAMSDPCGRGCASSCESPDQPSSGTSLARAGSEFQTGR